MNAEWSKKYHLIESHKSQESVLSIYLSSENDDALWDEFLIKTSAGQFQQSSMWAQVKEMEGWKSLRVIATIDDCIVGGFQILWRESFLGKIGYVSKGPIAAPETQFVCEQLARLLDEQARNHAIFTLIVQPPDESRIMSEILNRFHFIKSNPTNVIESTLVVDVSKDQDALDKGMDRKTRRNVRKAIQGGVTIREGTNEDIGLFFKLMLATCQRQGVKPNPPSEKALGKLWQTFSKNNCLRVSFAEYNNKAVAGSLNIVFGGKVNLWKKGWNFEHPDRYPNDLLYYEILHWACNNHYKNCDFIGFDKGIADALLNGVPLSDAQEKSRHIFNLRFGGMPKHLPPARIWFANPCLRFGYGNILALLSRLKQQDNHL